jgi:hypothetical protein
MGSVRQPSAASGRKFCVTSVTVAGGRFVRFTTQALDLPITPMVSKVPTQESDMNRTNFRIVLRKTACSMAIGLALSSHASAGFMNATAEQRAACTPDVFRLCASAIPNVDNIIACMKAKKSSLSPTCSSVFNPPADQAMSTKTASGK